jgi:hypothetical protein
MSRFILSLSLMALIASGCGGDGSSNDQAYRQEPLKNKPVVSVVPVIDNTKNDYDWNLSDEFSSAIYYRLSQHSRLSIVDAHKVRAKTKKLGERNNPFGPDISWVKSSFPGDEFVVFLELVEHEEVLNQNRKKPSDPKNCSADLNMTMRARVFDLRGSEPKVILQELVHDTHFIPRPFTRENFYQVAWGDESYSISPIGLAHAKFTKEIALRIEDYILTMAKQ